MRIFNIALGTATHILHLCLNSQHIVIGICHLLLQLLGFRDLLFLKQLLFNFFVADAFATSFSFVQPLAASG